MMVQFKVDRSMMMSMEAIWY